VRPGGVVVYATCSPHLAETRDVLAALPEADVESVRQLWPHLDGTDAMSFAVLRRSPR
jgi:16S rRNA (cytosine967-C5)-methyltransferase